jgi:hypothetical protein
MISGKARRVLVYTAALLIAPMPLMPFERGEREYSLALIACGIILTLGSFYVVYGEMKYKHYTLVGNRLLISALITFIFGLLLFLGALIHQFLA